MRIDEYGREVDDSPGATDGKMSAPWPLRPVGVAVRRPDGRTDYLLDEDVIRAGEL